MTERPVETILMRMDGIAQDMIREGVSLPDAVVILETALIGRALASTNGNVTRAARTLGRHRNTLGNRLRKYKAAL